MLSLSSLASQLPELRFSAGDRKMRAAVADCTPDTSVLNLSNFGVSHLPATLGSRCRNVELLNCANNRQLRQLPDSFTGLQKLRILFFLNCGFERVPPQIKSLRDQLYMLSFKACPVKEIKDDDLPPHLSWFIITGCHIPRLPDSFGLLVPRMRKLMLSGNRLTSLPDSFVKLQSLEMLCCADNLIETLPSGMLETMPKLSWIGLANNPLCEPAGSEAMLNVIEYSDLEIGQELGRGGGGITYKADYKGAAVAVKIFTASREVSCGDPRNEVVACCSIPRHQNTIGCLGGFSEPQLGCVFEFLEGYDVLGGPPDFDTCTRDIFCAGKCVGGDAAVLTPGAIRVLSLGIARGAQHMHSHGWCHGDLYAHNTLVKPTDFETVRLADFGATFKAKDLGMRPLLEKVEVRSFGAFLDDLLKQSSKLKHESGSCRPMLVDLKEACMNDDPSKRPNFEKIVHRLELAATIGTLIWEQ